MKIAVVSNDQKSVTSHFGQATCYVVFQIEDGHVLRREIREKPAHSGSGKSAVQASDQGRQRRSLRATLKPVSDCDMIVAREMGASAYKGIQETGMQPIITDIEDMDEVANACVEGRLVDHPGRQEESLRARQLSSRLAGTSGKPRGV